MPLLLRQVEAGSDPVLSDLYREFQAASVAPVVIAVSFYSGTRFLVVHTARVLTTEEVAVVDQVLAAYEPAP